MANLHARQPKCGATNWKAELKSLAQAHLFHYELILILKARIHCAARRQSYKRAAFLKGAEVPDFLFKLK